MKMRSTTGGQHSFAQIPSAEIERSSFNRSCGLKTAFDSGLLIPVFCDELLPGDTMKLRMHNFVRMATPANPVLDNLWLESHFFAIPIRLIWDDFKRMMGEQDKPGDTISFSVPQHTSPGGAAEVSKLSDYLGIPPRAINLTHSALWHRAYNLCHNEWFRDESLTDPAVVDKGPGPDTHADYKLLRRGKRKDYFTSCLPAAQKGAAVALPLGTTAPIVSEGSGVPIFKIGTDIALLLTGDNTDAFVDWDHSPTDISGSAAWQDPRLEVDLSAATGATISALRLAFQTQRLLERDARGGSRYTESVRSHFGVVSPDSRLQRTEFIGGGTQNISITPVPSATHNTNAFIGDLGGYGTSTGSNHTVLHSATEHCVVLGLVSVRADLSYQEGLARMFSRKTRFDFYWPALAHISEQPVLNKEIWANNVAADELTFGFQEAWADYRYKPSTTSGIMRSSATGSLDVWHLSEKYTALPVLGNTFIESNPPVDRVIVTQGEVQWLADFFFEFTHTRPMPTYSVPGMIDHF